MGTRAAPTSVLVTREELERRIIAVVSNFVDAAYRYDQETHAIEWVLSIDTMSGENPITFPYLKDQYGEDAENVK